MWRVSEPLQSPLLTIQSSLCGGQWAEPVSQSDVMLKPPHYNYADSAPSPASLHQSLCKNETENDASLGFIKHNIDSINRTYMCIYFSVDIYNEALDAYVTTSAQRYKTCQHGPHKSISNKV